MRGYWLNNVIRVPVNEDTGVGYELFTEVLSSCDNCEVRVDLDDYGIHAYDYTNNEIDVIMANKIERIK